MKYMPDTTIYPLSSGRVFDIRTCIDTFICLLLIIDIYEWRTGEALGVGCCWLAELVCCIWAMRDRSCTRIVVWGGLLNDHCTGP